MTEFLSEKYKKSKKLGERAACAYHAIRYAKNNNTAFQLGILVLKDKSKIMRYRAAMLLAAPQKHDAIEPLQKLAEKNDTDATAAINAQNQNLFLDRNSSGKITLLIN